MWNRFNTSAGDHVTALSYQSWSIGLASITSKNRPAADRPTAALGHASVLMLHVMPPHPRRVRGPPTMIFASAGNVVPPPPSVIGGFWSSDHQRRRRRRLVLPSLSTLADFIILTLVVPSLYDAVRQQWLLRELPWELGAQRSRTSTLSTLWRLHAATFYDCLARRMCWYRLHSVAPTATSTS